MGKKKSPMMIVILIISSLALSHAQVIESVNFSKKGLEMILYTYDLPQYLEGDLLLTAAIRNRKGDQWVAGTTDIAPLSHMEFDQFRNPQLEKLPEKVLKKRGWTIEIWIIFVSRDDSFESALQVMERKSLYLLSN